MNKTSQKTLFSSKSSEWSTPTDFYDKLDKQFNFTLDPCATEENHKTAQYFTEKDDGLTQDWEGNTVFMNPPYGRDIRHWIEKAYKEGQKPNTTVVCLIPARTDTRYWHSFCMKAQAIYFLRGRLKFGNSKNSAPFPSAVVVFSSNKITFPALGVMER